MGGGRNAAALHMFLEALGVAYSNSTVQPKVSFTTKRGFYSMT